VSRPPKVVALGGGHGVSATLTAARRYAGEITAIVSAADDGGSSGRLREAFGLPAPGDLRRCLVALGDPDSVWTQVFEHRFDGTAGDLEGHTLGNLVIAGLTAATGDFVTALEEAGRLVGAVGRVLPATSVPVVLRALVAEGEVEGQVRVASAGRIAAVVLDPPGAPTTPEAVAALQGADQVILGPGSLFTSVIAAAIPTAVTEAIRTTTARRIYVCNLDVRERETAGYDVASHVGALLAHGIEIDVVLTHEGGLPLGDSPVPVVARPLAAPGGEVHDPERLALALEDLLG